MEAAPSLPPGVGGGGPATEWLERRCAGKASFEDRPLPHPFLGVWFTDPSSRVICTLSVAHSRGGVVQSRCFSHRPRTLAPRKVAHLPRQAPHGAFLLLEGALGTCLVVGPAQVLASPTPFVYLDQKPMRRPSRPKSDSLGGGGAGLVLWKHPGL